MAKLRTETSCPICATSAQALEVEGGSALDIECRNCGPYVLSDSAARELAGSELDEVARARIAHGVRKMQERAVVISTATLRSLAEGVRLPEPLEQLDRLVEYLATKVPPGKDSTLVFANLRAELGAVNAWGVSWACREAVYAGLIRLTTGDVKTWPKEHGHYLEPVSLTSEGWRRFAALRREGRGSRRAFLAMKFGDPELDLFVARHMKPAVLQTDFDLRANNEDHQAAGSIDDQMRVEIRTSRFVVCDLTHGNRGAYWEAGFAEGIGRPVFYTCKRALLDDPSHPDHPHFDTAHQLVIPWDLADPETFTRKLKSAIRATLPAEARMEDS